MHPHILNFINKQTCATISCVEKNLKPYCFTVFYSWDAERKNLIYKSSPQSHHSNIMVQNGVLAGTILPDRLNKLVVQGIQFEGILLDNKMPETKNAFAIYHKRHPIAIVKPGELWVIQVNHIKMTDSTKGFGTKLHWSR